MCVMLGQIINATNISATTTTEKIIYNTTTTNSKKKIFGSHTISLRFIGFIEIVIVIKKENLIEATPENDNNDDENKNPR